MGQVEAAYTLSGGVVDVEAGGSGRRYERCGARGCSAADW